MTVIRYSRLRHFVLTLADIGLVALAAYGIQHPGLAVAIPCGLLLALASLAFLTICREWLSPSRIVIDGRTAMVEWGNWRLSGIIQSIGLSERRPRHLVLVLGDPQAALVPVGPLFIAAGFVFGPLLGLLLPSRLARLYYLDKRQLLSVQSDGTARAELSFPLIFFGKRRVSHALKSALG
jgi:hypothetical protein